MPSRVVSTEFETNIFDWTGTRRGQTLSTVKKGSKIQFDLNCSRLEFFEDILTVDYNHTNLYDYNQKIKPGSQAGCLRLETIL